MQAVLASASSFFGGALGMAVTWALFPIFAFFFLRDFDELKARSFELIPFRWREGALDHYVRIDGKMAAFVRGQAGDQLVRVEGADARERLEGFETFGQVRRDKRVPAR